VVGKYWFLQSDADIVPRNSIQHSKEACSKALEASHRFIGGTSCLIEIILATYLSDISICCGICDSQTVAGHRRLL